jgi:AcrR family transcriptional regulator
MYTHAVPKLWNATIEAHRREVREAILRTTAALASEHGLRAVTMSQIAEQAGIGRATLYKYFPDVEAILTAWHDEQITSHLAALADIRDQTSDPEQRLEVVLAAFAHHAHQSRNHGETELGAFLHRDEHLVQAQQRLHDMIRDLLADCAQAGVVRTDIDPEELASYCTHALFAARTMPSATAVSGLVTVTLAGLRPSPTRSASARRRREAVDPPSPHSHAKESPPGAHS